MSGEVGLRISVVRPVHGVAYRVQEGRDGLLPPARESGGEVSFDFAVRLGRGEGAAAFGGPFAQGRPAERFVYVCSGARAGQHGSPWTRRAKVPLAGITPEMVREALSRPGARIEARIEGAARDGGPACASVPLLDGGWRLSEG